LDAGGPGGFVINGAASFDLAGNSVSSIGDVNGDGLPDILVGALGASPSGRDVAGRAYVVFGKGSTTSVELASLDAGGPGGFVINGAAPNDEAGFSVSGLGDVNSDGLPDILVGVPFASPSGRASAGRAYVVFGKGSTTSVDLASLNAGGPGGFVINGAAPNDEAGFSVSSIGDVNGDGLPDILVGVPFAFFSSPSGIAGNGRAYVVFGKGSTTSVDLASLNAGGPGGFVINGTADLAGYSVSGLGDVNGDGLPDILVGAPSASPSGRDVAGRVYVVFGKGSTTSVDLASLNAGGPGGFVINGAESFDRAGRSVSGLGDLNGDGLPDILVGAYSASPSGRASAGRAYVVFGKGSTTSVDLASLNAGGPGGFVINGAAPVDLAGNSVSSIGDVNGDGLPDILVGAYSFPPSGGTKAGRAYVVFGKSADTNPIELLDVQLSALSNLNSVLRGGAVTFTGNNLSSVSSITLGSAIVPFARNSSTRLTAIVPAGVADGANTFSLSTPLDGTVSINNFQVLSTPAGVPTVSTVNPTTGLPGTRVTVNGTNLTSGTSVSFCNGTLASGRASASQILFPVPNGAISGPVTVTTTNGSYNFLFTVPVP
jgi:FG-GAP repeat/IPT/TIG domain